MNAVKNNRPIRSVYDDPRWRKIRQVVLHTDDHTCWGCGHHDPTGRSLVVDHSIPIDQIDDPFDIANLRTMCLRCSGRKDGGRASHARSL